MSAANRLIGIKMSGMLMLLLILSCNHHKKIYKSSCDDGRVFKKMKFKNLVDSFASYDKQYVEITGKYQQDKDMSVLVDDSLANKGNKRVLWVDFSPNCPLYLVGTRTGFFDYDNNNGALTPANNKVVTIRGLINCKNRGHLNAYKGTIEHISYVAF